MIPLQEMFCKFVLVEHIVYLNKILAIYKSLYLKLVVRVAQDCYILLLNPFCVLLLLNTIVKFIC